MVDESDMSRIGYPVALERAGAEVTGSVCHDQIHTLDDDALRLDIAVVNLADPRPVWSVDDFPGLNAVSDILRRTDRPPLIVGYTTFWDHAGLRLRAKAAGVKYIFSRSQLEDDHFQAPLGEMILALATSPTPKLDTIADHDEQRVSLGIPSSGDIEALVAHAGQMLLSEDMVGEQAQYQLRKEFGAKHAVAPRTKDGNHSNKTWPSWDQVDRIWRWLAKAQDSPSRQQRLDSQR